MVLAVPPPAGGPAAPGAGEAPAAPDGRRRPPGARAREAAADHATGEAGPGEMGLGDAEPGGTGEGVPAWAPGAPVRLSGWAVTLLAATGMVALSLGTFLLTSRLMHQVGRSISDLRATALDNRVASTATRDVVLALEAAGAAQRGMLLGLEDEVEPFREAEAAAARGLDRLRAQGRQLPWLPADVEALSAAAHSRMAALEGGLRLGRGAGGGVDLAVLVASRRDMQAAREVAERITTHAEADIARRTREIVGRERAFDHASRLTVGGGLLLLGLAVLGLLLGRQRLLQAQATAQLRAEWLRSAVGHIRDGVALFDAEGRLLVWNARFFAATELPGALARVGTPFAAVAERLAAWAPPLFARTAPELPGRPVVAEMRLGERVIEVWRSRLPDGGQTVAVADISRRSQAEAALRHAQKMDLLGEMTGGVAHDFNSLLQVVSANLELLAARLPARTPQEQWLHARLEAAQGGVARGARLTRHLLAFARRQPLSPEFIDTERLLRGLRELVQPLLDATIRLEVTVEPGLWPVRVDPQGLEGVLLNLATNARDAMPEGGRLRVRARNLPADGEAADQVEITVADTGTGMTPEQCARASEPFFTTKPEGRGTGLGLPMAFGFAEQSGGRLHLESEPGRGTTLRLCLPRAAAEPAAAGQAQAGAATGEGEPVLLVEGDEAVRAGTAEVLRLLGYRVAEAADAGAALRLLEEGLRPMLLLADASTPDAPTPDTPDDGADPAPLPGAGNARGAALAARARALVPDLAVLLASGSAAGPDEAGVLAKPWRVEELGTRVRRLLDAQAERPLAVLLVEDSAGVRAAAIAMLEDAGHQVTAAADATSALARLDAGTEVLVTDLGLPDMGGRALVREARRRRPGLPVVVASGHAEEADAAAEGLIWLQKPFDSTALAAAVRTAWRRRARLRQAEDA